MNGHHDAIENVRRLQGLSLEALRGEWRERIGAPPKLRSPELLRLLLAWRIQAEAFGDLDRETRQGLKSKAAPSAKPKLQTGLRLTREWQGRRYEVEVVGEHFVFAGRTFRSLSEVAREITGTRWNGPRFFGLRRAA